MQASKDIKAILEYLQTIESKSDEVGRAIKVARFEKWEEVLVWIKGIKAQPITGYTNFIDELFPQNKLTTLEWCNMSKKIIGEEDRVRNAIMKRAGMLKFIGSKPVKFNAFNENKTFNGHKMRKKVRGMKPSTPFDTWFDMIYFANESGSNSFKFGKRWEKPALFRTFGYKFRNPADIKLKTKKADEATEFMQQAETSKPLADFIVLQGFNSLAGRKKNNVK